jgi:hypothetical protein
VSGLPQREIEGRAFVRPAPIVEVGVLLGLVVEQRQCGQVLRERLHRPRARERQVGAARRDEVVLGPVVGHVLTDAL